MNALESCYTDRAAMISAWIDCHGGIDDDKRPKVSPSGERMFAAGLSHARKQAAAQIEARAHVVGEQPWYGAIASELFAMAEKIRSEQ